MKSKTGRSDTPARKPALLQADPGRTKRVSKKQISRQKTLGLTEANKALRKSESTLKSIFSASPAGIMLITPDRKIGLMNDKMTTITGYRLEDIEDGDPRIFYPTDEEFSRVGKLIVGRISQGNAVEVDTTWIRKDGEIRHIHLSQAPIDPDDFSAGAVSIVADVTERKEAETKLLESEERYRTVIEHSNDGIALVSNNLYIYVNQKFLEIFGYDKPEDVLGKRPLITVHPDDFELLEKYGKKRLQGEPAPEKYEYKGIRKDGTTIFVEVSVAETTYQGGAVVLSYLRDITGRKLNEEALKRNEERFRTMIEKSWDVIALYNERQRTYVSPAITVVLGYSEEEYTALDRNELIHPDDAAVVDSSWSYIESHPGRTINFVNRLRHKDESWRWVETSIRNLVEEPSVNAVLETFHDITDRKLVEEALKQNEEHFRALVEKSSEVIFLTDENRKLIYVSPSITRILGYTVEEFLSFGQTAFTHPDDIIKVETARSHVLANPGASVTFVDRMRHKNGDWCWAECTVHNLLDEPSVHSLVVNFHDITERKMTEEALRESENKFRDLAEKSIVGIYITQDKVFKYVNARFAEIHGYTIEEIIDKKTLQEMIFPKDLLLVNKTTPAKSSSTVKSLNYEFRIITKTGDIKYVEVYGTRTIFQGKRAIIGAIIDITERKNAEEALKKSEEKYRNIFENATEGIFQTTLDGQFISANPALARILGFNSLTELIPGMAATANTLYVNREDRQVLIGFIEDHDAAEGFETKYVRKDGKIIWVSINSQVIRDKNGKTAYYEGTITDITNRKLAEEALQESEAKYRSVVDNLLVGFYITQDDRFRFVSRAFCEASGYSYDELVDKMNPLDLIHDDDKEFIAGIMVKRLAGKIDHEGHVYKVLRKDGQVMIVKGVNNLMIYNGRPAVAGGIMDITRETTLESQLRQAQKMEAVGTLAGGIAHDFNNILTAIIGYGRLLQMKMTETDPLRAYVAHMLSSSETAANLTRNLLAFSRKQIIQLKPVKVGTIVKGIERLLKSLLTEDIELKTMLPDSDITIMADMSQIEQVLLNLASNANDAMPRGGTLTIETKEVELKNMFFDGYECVEPGQYVLISVADTGTGIDEKTRDKIFEPFFTTKEVGKGTGLGLSIVHGIVDQHHGYITVNTKPQGGTVFHVYLPVVKAAIEETEAISPAVEGGKETILVAEDDAQVRGLTVEILNGAGYSVIEAIDGEDAIKKFIEHSDTVELLLLDVVMPRMNGKDAYDEMRKTSPDIKVIFVSGYTGDVIMGKGIIGKEYDFIQKPLSPNELLIRVGKALGR